MATINEEARIPVYINDEQARAALKTLTGEAEKLRQKMAEALAAGDMEGYKKAQKELNKVTREANNLRKASFDVNKVLENLSSASVKDLRKALSAVRREQEGLNRDTAEYQALQKKVDAINSELRKVNGTMVEQKGVLGNIITQAKGLLPAFSLGAIAAGAVAAFGQIKNATDTFGTQWDVFVGGLKGAMNEFWRTIAAGDWSNFLDNMREAVRVGREYVATMDDIEEKTRALSVTEADARRRILELEDQVRNRQLSNEERIKAGEERVKIEEELAEKRKKVAQEEFDAELMLTMQQTRLSKEQLMEAIGDLDSEKKAKAKAYNEQLAELESFQKAQRAVARSGGGANLLDTDRVKQIKADLASASDSVKAYAEVVRGTGKTTDEQLNKLVAAYGKVSDADVSALENTRRVRTQVNNLLKQETDELGKEKGKQIKIEEDNLKLVLSALDQAHEQRLLKIEQQAVEEKKTQETINIEKALAERAYLEQKLALLQQAGQSGIEIQRALIQRELELIKQADDEIKRLREQNASEFEAWLNEKIKSENDALTESVNNNIEYTNNVIKQGKDLAKEERETLASRADSMLAFTESIGDSFQEFLVNQNQSFADFLRNTLIDVLDFLERLLVAAIAQETIKAIMKGAPINPIAVAKAVAKIIMLKAAFGIAKSAIMGGKKSDGFEEGGYTGRGAKDEPAGVVHKGEYVVPAVGLDNPTVKEVIDIIEQARKNNQLKTINLAPIREDKTMRQYNSGGYVTSSTSPVPVGVQVNSPVITKDMVDKFADAVDKLSRYRPPVAIEQIHKELKDWENIQRNRKM